MAGNFSRHRLFPIALYALVVAIVFGSALFPQHGMLIFGDDIHRYFSFIYAFANESLRRGEIPWWNPYLLNGLPFLESPKVAFLYPPNWLLAVFPTATAFSWYVAFHVFVAMTGMYWFVRQWTARLPAWIAGVAYGLSGFFSARIFAGHIDMIATASIAPFAFRLFWLAMSNTGRGGTVRLVRAAIGIALLYISGYQIIAFFFYEAMAISAFMMGILRKSVRPIITGIGVFALGLGIAAIQLIPNILFISRSVRTFPFPYTWSAIGALSPRFIVEFIQPFFYGDQGTYFGAWQFYHERAAFVGKATMIVSLAALLFMALRQSRKVEGWVLGAIALFGLWMAMANNAPVDLLELLRRFIPVYQTIRIPSRHLILFIFGVSALAGLGIGMMRNRVIQGFVALLVLLELIPFARHFITLSPQGTTSYDQTLLSRFTGSGTLFRVLPNFNIGHNLRDTLDFDSGMRFRFFSATGYETAMLRNYYEFIDATNMRDEPSFTIHDVQVPYLTSRAFAQGYADFLNVRYILVPVGLDPIGKAQPEHFTSITENQDRGYRLYENRLTTPRFFLVSQAEMFDTREEIAHAIRTGRDLTKTLLVSRSEVPKHDRVSECVGETIGSVTAVSYGLSRIELGVEATCDAIITSSEVMYPGWRATVDGVRAHLFEGNLAFRSLFIPKGKHTVVMEYQPEVLYVGAGVSIGTIAGAILLVRRRRKK